VAYSRRLQDTLRMTVRATLGEFTVLEDDGSTGSGAATMPLERFLECLDLLLEQLLALLQSAAGVNEFCLTEGYLFEQQEGGEELAEDRHAEPRGGPFDETVSSAAELSSKSVSEILRLRKETHAALTLEEVKRIHDACSAFASQVETIGKIKAITLRSSLQAQTKAFVERRHERNMSALAVALDSERWGQCEVTEERQASISRLISGLAALPGPSLTSSEAAGVRKSAEVEVEGIRYKTVWSCLLLVEMITENLAVTSQYQILAGAVINKIAELLRLFNTRSAHLVLGTLA
jgi:vacuolar protein sorting-associated protein 54